MRNHAVTLTVAYLIIVALIGHTFWSYWSTLLI